MFWGAKLHKRPIFLPIHTISTLFGGPRRFLQKHFHEKSKIKKIILLAWKKHRSILFEMYGLYATARPLFG